MHFPSNTLGCYGLILIMLRKGEPGINLEKQKLTSESGSTWYILLTSRIFFQDLIRAYSGTGTKFWGNTLLLQMTICYSSRKCSKDFLLHRESQALLNAYEQVRLYSKSQTYTVLPKMSSKYSYLNILLTRFFELGRFSSPQTYREPKQIFLKYCKNVLHWQKCKILTNCKFLQEFCS